MNGLVSLIISLVLVAACDESQPVEESGGGNINRNSYSTRTTTGGADYGGSSGFTNNCSTYSATDCSSRGCELQNGSCVQGGTFSGSCSTYSDSTSCSRYSISGCIWQPSGGMPGGGMGGMTSGSSFGTTSGSSFGTTSGSSFGTTSGSSFGTTSGTEMGSSFSQGTCLSSSQNPQFPGNPNFPGMMPQNNSPRFNGLAAVAAGLQCLGGGCGNNMFGAMSNVLMAGMTPMYPGMGMPGGGGMYYGGGMPGYQGGMPGYQGGMPGYQGGMPGYQGGMSPSFSGLRSGGGFMGGGMGQNCMNQGGMAPGGMSTGGMSTGGMSTGGMGSQSCYDYRGNFCQYGVNPSTRECNY